jgi:hypothetical protein
VAAVETPVCDSCPALVVYNYINTKKYCTSTSTCKTTILSQRNDNKVFLFLSEQMFNRISFRLCLMDKDRLKI